MPAISGTAIQGHTLSASPGAWSNRATSYTYQWEDCASSGLSCAAITGATSEMYTLAASDVSHAIRVQGTAINAGGAGRPAISIPTTVVTSDGRPTM